MLIIIVINRLSLLLALDRLLLPLGIARTSRLKLTF